jgi:hypothetical protein
LKKIVGKRVERVCNRVVNDDADVDREARTGGSEMSDW